jgi:hypothetical protein
LNRQDGTGEGYIWRIDNLILSVSAVGSVDKRAFAERLDERAGAVR